MSTFSKSEKSLHLVLGWGHVLYPHSLLAMFPCNWAPPSLSLSLAFGLKVSLPAAAIHSSSNTQVIVFGLFQKLVIVLFSSCIICSVSEHEINIATIIITLSPCTVFVLVAMCPALR